MSVLRGPGARVNGKEALDSLLWMLTGREQRD